VSSDLSVVPLTVAALARRRRLPAAWRAGPAVLSVWALLGCADRPLLPEPMNVVLPPSATPAGAADRSAAPESTRIDRLPSPKAPVPVTPRVVTAAARPDATAAAPAPSISVEQMPVLNFAQIVFVEAAKKNLDVDPQVVARRDLVTYRTGGPQTVAQLQASATMLLKNYGISVIDIDGNVRLVPDNANLGNLPEIRRGAALPDTPLPLRPIFYLVDLQAVRSIDVMNWLRTLFGERVRAQEDPNRNALLINGTPDNVQAALEAIRMLDQPVLAGGQSLAINPVHWSAEDLARRMIEILLAQGYAVQPPGQATAPGGIRYPIIVLPVASINAVYVFARGDEVVKHISDLARSLDKPNERGIGKNFFTYAVKHKDAAVLAETLSQLLSGVTNRSTVAASTPAPAAGSTGSAGSGTRGVVVDKSTNTLIFQVGQEEYAQIIALLQTLDRPTKAALIEVTVAELSVDDSARLGVEWGFTDSQGSGGTAGGLGLGTAGLNYRILNSLGGVKVALNALASANRATILSSPRVLARNGESATIQVGQEVPIVTSQQSTSTTSGTSNTPQILQTIQYRSTGVILKVKPVIHSGDQIDLDVSQEVSAAQSTSTGVSASPTFSTRKVDTKLTLRNGATVMLGGLISEEGSRGDTGVPGLKDIPILGALFTNQNQSRARRELIVLITPYLINDNDDAEAVTEAFRRILGPWAAQPPKATLPVEAVKPAAPASAPQ
jgi:general secretion pathway protein D